MNAKYLVSIGAVALFTAACGYSIKTATDYNRNVRFSNYHSFYIMKGNSSGNPLMDQRATADVESALAAKGWSKVPEGQGQAEGPPVHEVDHREQEDRNDDPRKRRGTLRL